MLNDPYNLQHFIDAQGLMYDKALAELKAGKKRNHWMRYTFPQTAKVGMGSVAKRFAISGLTEAKAYWEHPILGSRLCECMEAVQSHKGMSLLDIFGSELDVMKYKSCVQLFQKIETNNI
ncbi:MAG: DUF1810 family protein [Epsilonproteobacteria bacterium]|nr:DUF1810 family protein [Campylobacterota bacterium]